MQAAEPFIWTFGDTASVLLSSMLLLLLFSSISQVESGVALLPGADDQEEMAGRAVPLCDGGYGDLSALGSGRTMVLCARYTFLGNQWSETAALLGYSSLGETLQVPAAVKAMESMQPLGCMIQAALLLFGYSLTLSFLILLGSLLFDRERG